MREFHQNLKVSLSNAKNENYQLQREADQLMRDKIHLSQQISFCEKRVEDLEKCVGIQPKNTLNTSYNEVNDF
jgi:predicted  nucleic acid-binding Zn-ribbon protein